MTVNEIQNLSVNSGKFVVVNTTGLISVDITDIHQTVGLFSGDINLADFQCSKTVDAVQLAILCKHAQALGRLTVNYIVNLTVNCSKIIVNQFAVFSKVVPAGICQTVGSFVNNVNLTGHNNAVPLNIVAIAVDINHATGGYFAANNVVQSTVKVVHTGIVQRTVNYAIFFNVVNVQVADACALKRTEQLDTLSQATIAVEPVGLAIDFLEVSGYIPTGEVVSGMKFAVVHNIHPLTFGMNTVFIERILKTINVVSAIGVCHIGRGVAIVECITVNYPAGC